MTHAEVEAVMVVDKKKPSLSREKVVVAVPLLLWSGTPDEPAKTCATYHADDSDNNDAESLAHKSKGGSDDSEASSVASSSQEEELIASETELSLSADDDDDDDGLINIMVRVISCSSFFAKVVF